MKERDAFSLLRILWCAVAALVCGVVGARIWRLAEAAGPWDVVDLIYDDAYYYLALAANTVESGRSTLDGSTLTNGYQPLWFLLITFLGIIIGTDPMQFFRGFVVLLCAIVVSAVLAGVPLRKHSNNIARSALAIGIGLSVALWGWKVFLTGMEVILFLPLVIPLVMLMERPTGRRNAIYLSTVFALAFLVRLDALALVPSYIAVCFLVDRWGARRHAQGKYSINAGRRFNRWSLLWLLAVVGPVVLCYVAINVAVYGTPVPVSGLAKGIGPAFENFGVVIGYLRASAWLLPILAVLLVTELVAYRKGISSKQFLQSIAVCTIACILQALYYSVASTWILWNWYYIYIALIMILLTARTAVLLSMLWEGSLQLIPVGGVAAVIVITLGGVIVDFRDVAVVPESAPTSPPLTSAGGSLEGERIYTFNEVSLIMLRDFFRGAQPLARVAMGDRAGGLAYWGRPAVQVVHTEGLLLGISYIQARRAGTADEYIVNDKDIAYYVVDRDWIPSKKRENGQTIYVIADPIQGVKTSAEYPVAIFCFPEEAVRYRLRYRWVTGPTERVAFEFDQRVACSEDEAGFISDALDRGELRRFSLPNEYK